MTASFEFCFQPCFDHGCNLFGTVLHPPAQNQNVCIIVFAAHSGSIDIVTERSPNAFKLVGGNRHPDTGAAAKNSAGALLDFPGDLHGILRIIYRFISGSSQILIFISKGIQDFFDLFFQIKTAVITGYRDLHQGLAKIQFIIQY